MEKTNRRQPCRVADRFKNARGKKCEPRWPISFVVFSHSPTQEPCTWIVRTIAHRTSDSVKTIQRRPNDPQQFPRSSFSIIVHFVQTKYNCEYKENYNAINFEMSIVPIKIVRSKLACIRTSLVSLYKVWKRRLTTLPWRLLLEKFQNQIRGRDLTWSVRGANRKWCERR